MPQAFEANVRLSSKSVPISRTCFVTALFLPEGLELPQKPLSSRSGKGNYEEAVDIAKFLGDLPSSPGFHLGERGG